MINTIEPDLSIGEIEKVFDDNRTTVPVVFATDNGFIPYLAVALQSLVDNTSKDNNYDIVILYTDVDEFKLNQLKAFSTDNISVRTFDMSELMDRYKELWYTHWSYSAAVYYRFFIPELFKDYEKVLYLDGDIIILSDIAELYEIDLEDNYIGAVAELSMNHEKSPAYEYIPKTLGLENKKYFNSGILSINVSKLQNVDFFKKCIDVLQELGEPIFPDQDVLNIVCANKVKYLNHSFNITWNSINFYKDIENYISEEEYQLFKNAIPTAKIFHYCGAYKPWKQPWLPYSNYFWKYARKTDFYEEIIYKNTKTYFNRNLIRNAIYRRRIYFQYLRCKLMKLFTFGTKKEHYTNKVLKLKQKIMDYRNTLNK